MSCKLFSADAVPHNTWSAEAASSCVWACVGSVQQQWQNVAAKAMQCFQARPLAGQGSVQRIHAARQYAEAARQLCVRACLAASNGCCSSPAE